MKETDRRSRKTKKMLKELFIDLLKQRPLKKITITELCELADINRSTFYLHYCDIYALLEDIEKDCLSEFEMLAERITCQTISPDQVTKIILEYIYSQKDLLSLLLLKNSEDSFWQKLNQKIVSLFKIKTLQNYQLPELMDENEFDDMILFFTYGFYAIYKKWLAHNCNENIDIIAEKTTLFCQICFNQILICND